MSARTLPRTGSAPLLPSAPSKVLPLPAGFFQIRKNGIEFQSSTAIPEWTEMTVEVETSASGRKVRCTGVVVSCHGNCCSGYQVAMLFTDLTRQGQARLNDLAFASTR
jgi:hypothetical protein